MIRQDKTPLQTDYIEAARVVTTWRYVADEALAESLQYGIGIATRPNLKEQKSIREDPSSSLPHYYLRTESNYEWRSF